LKSLSYTIYIERTKNEYISYAPELSLQAKGETPELSYHKLKDLIKKKSEIFKNINIELNNGKQRSRKLSLKKYLISSLLVLLLLLSIQYILYSTFTQVLEHRYSRLERKVTETLSPSKKKQTERLERFKKNLEKVSPYYNIIKDTYIRDK